MLLIVTLTNLRYLRRLHSYTYPKEWPHFSVLVPARNEEGNIGDCVAGLLAQDYPTFQLIVLDDNSTDRTWEILKQFANKDQRLRLIKGKPLPSDWLGKHWACHQLAEEADGELLLFVDADTVHGPDMLRCTAAAMSGEQAALISALPRQHVVTWSEMLSIPAFYLGMLCGVPMRLTRLQRNPLLFNCLGQFLVFRRAAYYASGGYAAVRQNIVDDLAIGRRGLAIVMALILWSISNYRFHFPMYLILIYPLSAIFMTVVAFASMVLTIQGKALWKGRTMPKTVKL
ncbi:MAG: glycosyltransferase [Chloroflexi bacterium]|nr:glycosyltransferase [Chloroflexota bacterium]